MKKLLMALAACATTLIASAAIKTHVGFEGGRPEGFTVGGDSALVTYAETGTKHSPTNYPFFGQANDYYCEVDADTTEEGKLVSPTATDATYFDMYVQFPADASEPSPELEPDAKIAVYVNAASNVVVIAGDGHGGITTNETQTQIAPGDWARLTIAKVTDGYEVYVNGHAVQAEAFTPIVDGNPSKAQFTGVGKLDNYVARTTNPLDTYRITLKAPSNYTTTYQIGSATPIAMAAGETVNLTIPGFDTDLIVQLHINDGYMAKDITATKSGDTYTADGSSTTFTWDDYLSGKFVDGAYMIESYDDLDLFRKGVASGLPTSDVTFKLMNDIALDDSWPGIGIQNGKDLVNYDVSKIGQDEADRREADYEAGAFKGTFDGQNHTISNFQMAGGNLDYCGFFNSTLGATIKNLKIQYKSTLFAADTADSTEECGAAFVGVAKSSTLQNLTTVAGTVSCAKGFGGIVGYLMGGSTVDSCTNNVNLASLTSNKCGGIAMIAQGGSGTATIRNCVNNGTTSGNATQKGGIVGYVGRDLTIENSMVTAVSEPTILSYYGGTVTVSGVNIALDAVKPCIDKDGNAKAISGLTFATVDAEVATFVADNALAAGNTYKVMAPGTATYEFVNAGMIAFDTSLATPTYVITADTSTFVLSEPVTEGTVTTYTADAGVASVDNVAYATLADAVVAAGGNVITILTSGAAYEFTQAGTISLDESLAPATVTAVKGLALTDNTVDSVKTYTATQVVSPYAAWDYASGIVVWRAAPSQLFHVSTVADVGEYGQIGESYTLTNGGAHPWQIFASNQTQYRYPGAVLVFDEAGYNNNSDAQFAPLSFGGMWVKALQSENTPYCITDNKADGTNRQVELGATNAPCYFKFDESFTFNRNSATAVKGTATVEIAADKTFTINARAGKGAVVEADSTLVLKGAGTLAVVAGLSVNGTLDLSEATRPAIDGDVGLYGTIVLPEGTEVSPEFPFTVCSGTLSGLNVFAKIGDAEAVEKSFTAENGAITSFGEPQYIFYDNYPTVVPAGKTYIFVGGDSAENTVVVDALDVKGTLKTQGYLSFTNYKSNGSTLDVESGSLTLHPGNNWFNGTLTVESGATFVNALESDAVNYNGSFTANVYGTLDMGATRWTLGPNNTINLYEGCTVTGSGQGGNGAFDWIGGTLNVYGDVSLQAPIKIRDGSTANINADTTDQKGLTLAGTIGTGTLVKKGAGLVKFTTNPAYAITVENGAFTFAVDATPTITYSAKPGTGTTMSMWYATQATWKGTVVLGVLSAPTALPLNTYGNANSKIVLKGTTGNCYLDGTTTVTAEVEIDTDEDHVVEFNNGNSGQVGTFSKISGGGTLKLTGWTGCSGATYNINTITNFTGTLAIHNAITRQGGGTFTIGIGNIVTTGATTPGSKVLNLTQTAVSGATGTVAYNLDNAQLNGVAAKLEVKEDGIYVKNLVTVTVPAVANTTPSVTANGEPVEIVNGQITVTDGAAIVLTYTSTTHEVTNGTIEFTAADGYTVDVSGVSTKVYVAYVVFQEEQGNLTVDVTNYYTTVAVAIDAAKSLKYTVVLVAQPDAEDTYQISVGETINVKKGDFTFDGIIFPTGPQYINTTEVYAGVTKYKCTIYTVTVTRPGQEPLGMSGDLMQILGGVYSGYVPAYAGTVVTVLDGSDATIGDVMPDVFTYDSQAHTYTLKTMVASYDNGHVTTYYPTLAYAVENVITEGTIVLLADVTLTARVEPAKSMTIDLGGYTLSRTGTSGNGSVFDVKSGNVVITNGVIDCTQDDTAIAKDGVYAITARSGANVTLDTLTVTVDSECGACVYPFAGATVTILGGTYANRTSTPYRYKTVWTGMAVNQANVATQLITIYGGSFKQVNPALGDDSWASAGNGFLASGYAATWNPSTGYYDVAEKSSEPLEPGQSSKSYETQEEAEAAAESVEIAVPAAVAAELGSEAQATYKAMFEAKVVPNGEGGYKVEVALTSEAEADLQEQANADAAEVIEDLTDDDVTLTTTPGLYYSFEYGTSLGNMTEGARTLATGEKLELARPTTENATSGFYRVLVNVTDK